MRNPAGNAVYGLLLVRTSAGLIWFAAVRRESVGEHWTGVGPFILGFALLPFPLVFLVQALFATRGRARLLAGIGVIARWQVDPVEWGRFRGLDSRRSSGDFSLGSDLRIRRADPFGPVEIVVGETSALIDGSYHSLRPGGLPELRGVSWLARDRLPASNSCSATPAAAMGGQRR